MQTMTKLRELDMRIVQNEPSMRATAMFNRQLPSNGAVSIVIESLAGQI